MNRSAVALAKSFHTAKTGVQEGSALERAVWAKADAARKALQEQEHRPWVEAVRKMATGQTPAEKQVDNSGVEPSSRERRTKMRHDPAQHQEANADVDLRSDVDTKAAEATTGPEPEIDTASEGPHAVPDMHETQPDATREAPKDAPEAGGPQPRTEVLVGEVDATSESASGRGRPQGPRSPPCRSTASLTRHTGWLRARFWEPEPWSSRRAFRLPPKQALVPGTGR